MTTLRPTGRMLNLDERGIALQGHDPVAFFTERHPVKGSLEFSSEFAGARYLFASKQNKALFESNPLKYEPQFGGFCAYGVSEGYTAKVTVEAFQIVDGRLLMQYDSSVRDLFNKNTGDNL